MGAAWTGLALVLVALASGCDRSPPQPGHLSGARVAAMAERNLEQQNPRLAPGRLSCPDLPWRLRASVRCLRSTELSGGRVVKVAGTVTVMSLAAGGRLHVVMDERATEFGLGATELTAEVRRRYLQRFHATPEELACPYLPGVVGAKVTCRMRVGGAVRTIDVVVTDTDPAAYRTTYAMRIRRGS